MCFARLIDGDFVELARGDWYVPGQATGMCSPHCQRRVADVEPSAISGESLSLLRRKEIVPFGWAKAATRQLVCGYLACDKRLAPSDLRRLPRLLKIGCATGTTPARVHSSIAIRSRNSATIARARRWCSRVLSEVLFAEAVGRHWTRARRSGTGGSPRCATPRRAGTRAAARATSAAVDGPIEHGAKVGHVAVGGGSALRLA
jgi:hypothetical protein